MSKVDKRDNEEKMMLDSDGLFDTWSSDECYCQVRIINYVVTNLVTENWIYFIPKMNKSYLDLVQIEKDPLNRGSFL